MIDEKRLIEEIDNKVAGLTNIQMMQIADIIEEQPKVGEWIPCSERLPKDDMVCLITAYDRTEKRTVLKHRKFKNGRFMQSGTAKYSEVIAWMPLPPAYKGE